MTINIAVNGFGRIGRLVCRLAQARKDINIVAVNDLVPADNLAYLFKFDSTHGTFKGQVEADESALIIDGHRIPVFSEKDPQSLPWGGLKVDFVIESTGLFTTPEDSRKAFEGRCETRGYYRAGQRIYPDVCYGRK